MRAAAIFCSVIVAWSATEARAANVVFSEAAFLAEAQGVAVETFEDEPNSGTAGDGGVSQLSFDGFSVQASLPALKVFDSPVFGHDNTTVGGSKYMSVDTDLGGVSATATLTFNPPVYAVGFYLIGGDPGPSTLELDGVSYPIAPTGFDGNRYFGVLSNTPITTLTLTPDGSDSFWSLDDVSLGLDPSPQRFDVFFDRPAYLAAAGAVVVEDFEDEANSGTPGGGALAAIDLDAFTASSTPAAVKVLDATLLGAHNTTPGGAKFLAFDTDQGNVGSVGVLSFHAPTPGVGLVLVDVEQVNLAVEQVTVSLPGFDYPLMLTPPGGETYFAVLASPSLESIQIAPDAADSLWNIDDVELAVAPPQVPALSSGGALLLWTSLAAIGSASGIVQRRRRRHNA
jgi:hypothetical protein